MNLLITYVYLHYLTLMVYGQASPHHQGAICGIIAGFSFIAYVCIKSMGYRDFTSPLAATSIQGCAHDWLTSSNVSVAVVLPPIALVSNRSTHVYSSMYIMKQFNMLFKSIQYLIIYTSEGVILLYWFFK